MTAKEYLSRYLAANREIDALLDQRQQLWDTITRVTTTLHSDTVQGGQPVSASEALSNFMDLENMIFEKITALTVIMLEVEQTIHTVDDDKHRQILRLRYIGGKTFEEIADIMHYSWRQICRIHGDALQSIRMS
ncbi:sigma factor-like helix-turn-helix DNA-binding protein [Solibaculum mannosilyticum]|uniref:RNA polymerase sigma-70 region 4 domain-containing protein n=1 Tax=Solibaculum mannosilyticum TaxID=2780922 RepID=A0A7I8D1K2_9FIRM|nr:sigma factor-like helix-turn-helix DNA-binding protein [Solibaculum mannosilyticum]BCI60626.1 hypothetical protein C12CBH8_12650 [Solibaculum mannosilyticum]